MAGPPLARPATPDHDGIVREEAPRPAWLLVALLYAATPYLLTLPHVGAAVPWGVAVVVVAAASALAAAARLATLRLVPIARAEARLLVLYATGYAAAFVVLICALIGVANLVQALLWWVADVRISWVRMLSQSLYLVSIPLIAGGIHRTVWRAELVHRLPGTTSRFAKYDLGHTTVRFAVQSAALLTTIVLVLLARSWWVTVPGALVMAGAGMSLDPGGDGEDRGAAVADVARALRSLGYEVTLPTTTGPGGAVVNPLVQAVDLRAVRDRIDLAVVVRRGAPVTWEVADRLRSATRALVWSSGDRSPVPPHPLVVVLGAPPGDSLAAYAEDEEVSLVVVEPGGRSWTVDHVPGGGVLTALLAALRAPAQEP